MAECDYDAEMDASIGKRKLASLRRVKGKASIDGADKIELVWIGGWQVVAKRKEFEKGDLCVYFEIDSFLPEREEFEFLRSSSFRRIDGLGEGFRLKTIKLRGQISQGLALPLTSFPSIDFSSMQEGADLTKLLGVRKYDLPIVPVTSSTVLKKGNFPAFLRQTDQERIQNCFDDIQGAPALLDAEYEITLKMDGSSMTAYFRDGEFGVCSRNIELKDAETNNFWNAARTYHMEARLRRLGRNIALQGELMGPGIQKNRERFTLFKFFLFDVFDIDEHRLLLPGERAAVLAALNTDDLGMPIVNCPIIDAAGHVNVFPTIKEALDFAERPSLVHPIAEGVVFKHLTKSYSFKIISNKYLLKCEE